MFNQDSIDVRSLISYVNDIKPYHTKVLEVEVEYTSNENIGVGITEKHEIDTQLSSMWDVNSVSDGVRTTYRIPPVVLPRRSSSIYQCTKTGVSDEIPGMPGAYKVPHNIGMLILVDGAEQTQGIDYTLSADKTVVQFNPGHFPLSGSKICFDTFMLDRVFIALNGVWQDYDLIPIRTGDGSYYDVDPYDSKFELSTPQDLLYDGTIVADGSQTYSGFTGAGVPFTYDGEILADGSQTYAGFIGSDGSVVPTGYDGSADPLTALDGEPFDLYLSAIGVVRRVLDDAGRDYWVFEFYKAPALNTTIDIRVDQRETYAAFSKTWIKEHVSITDYISFTDSVSVAISILPGGFDHRAYDSDLDVFGFDPIMPEVIRVSQNPIDAAGASITESLTISLIG